MKEGEDMNEDLRNDIEEINESDDLSKWSKDNSDSDQAAQDQADPDLVKIEESPIQEENFHSHIRKLKASKFGKFFSNMIGLGPKVSSKRINLKIKRMGTVMPGKPNPKTRPLTSEKLNLSHSSQTWFHHHGYTERVNSKNSKKRVNLATSCFPRIKDQYNSFLNLSKYSSRKGSAESLHTRRMTPEVQSQIKCKPHKWNFSTVKTYCQSDSPEWLLLYCGWADWEDREIFKRL